MPLGLYISVPFCKTKCSYCNFASDVFSRSRLQSYVDRVCADMARAPETAAIHDARFERAVDTIYLGGGTPSLLEPAQLEQLFRAARECFDVTIKAEVTVECAPGTLSAGLIETLARCGVDRVSLGVQSLVDAEARAVGRLHTRATTLDDIAQLRAAGIANLNLDLIAGLPHQTAESWRYSLDQAIATGVPHISVYLLEVDEDSRLGRELIAGGARYHAHFVPDEDARAVFYEAACERLEAAGVAQYEISNFARPGHESRHNLKYWTRRPYVGFGVDAHSMLGSGLPEYNAVRLATPDNLEGFMSSRAITATPVSEQEAWEETFFLGLRMNRGVDLADVEEKFGARRATQAREVVQDLMSPRLVEIEGNVLRLTLAGRLLSNEIFERFLATPEEAKLELVTP